MTEESRSVRPLVDRLSGSFTAGRCATRRKMPTAVTGFAALDQLIGELPAGNLMLLGSRPAMGRTSFALNAAANVALNRTPVLVVAPGAGTQVAERSLAAVARASLARLQSDCLTASDWVKVQQATDQLIDAPMYLLNDPDITVARVESELSVRAASFVVIDSLHLLADSCTQRPDHEVTNVTRDLQQLARRCQVPVVATINLSNTVERRPVRQRRPGLVTTGLMPGSPTGQRRTCTNQRSTVRSSIASRGG